MTKVVDSREKQTCSEAKKKRTAGRVRKLIFFCLFGMLGFRVVKGQCREPSDARQTVDVKFSVPLVRSSGSERTCAFFLCDMVLRYSHA